MGARPRQENRGKRLRELERIATSADLFIPTKKKSRRAGATSGSGSGPQPRDGRPAHAGTPWCVSLHQLMMLLSISNKTEGSQRYHISN
jgi:hypothetical protein